jgi:hypothetical protein
VDLDELTERLFSIEKRVGLFADRSAGIPWWDAVRYRVNEFVYAALTGTPAAAPQSHRSLHARVLGWVKRASLAAALHFRIRWFKYDVLVLRAPRQMMNDKRLDSGIDDFVALCPGRVLTINTFPHYYHLPRRGSFRRHVNVGTALDRLIDALKSEFGGSLNESALRKMIAAHLADFVSDLAVYRKLLASLRPRFIIMTQNGIEKALFMAAHEAGIRVVEGQHGLISYSHAAYSYPRDADYGDRSTFPAVFLAFSEYWVRTCFYPAGRCVPIGNDHFALAALPPPTDAHGIMFVSGDLYHGVLVEWVTRLASAIPERKIIYKLHPNQQHAHRAIQQELASFKNIEVIDASLSARALLPRVAHVVLIQSTVALEALQTGRRVYILPLMHYQVHKDLFELQAVTVTPSVDHLIRALDTPRDLAAPPLFFDRFNVAAARELLRELSIPPVKTGTFSRVH